MIFISWGKGLKFKIHDKGTMATDRSTAILENPSDVGIDGLKPSESFTDKSQLIAYLSSIAAMYKSNKNKQ